MNLQAGDRNLVCWFVGVIEFEWKLLRSSPVGYKSWS